MMNDDHARKLRACTVLVDALVAAGDGRTPDTLPRDSLALALESVVSDGLVRFERGPDGKVQVDLMPILYGSLDLLMWLVRTLAQHADVDTFDVIADLRQQIADWTDAAAS